MRILQINSHHKMIGGTERYYLELSDLLRKRGHLVANFSLKDSKNYSSEWEKYFLDELDFSKNDYKSFIKKACRMFYSFEAKRKVERLLDDFKPDIVHIHNIYYYISPSILSVIKKRKIPVVQTVHDYQLISPCLDLFSNGRVNEDTKKNRYYKAVLSKSIKESYVASLMAAVASYIQHIFRLYERHVDYFIAPSVFMEKKLIEYGFDPRKIIHLPNFTNFSLSKTSNKPHKEKYVLYFGRLEEKKGAMFLLDVARSLPKVMFKMIGKYPDEKIKIKIKDYLSEHSIKNVTVLKFQESAELQQSITRSLFVLVPSLWYENMPYTILESYALGKPVVASRIGGISEIVKVGENGLLFEAGNLDDCEKKVTSLWENPDQVKRMGVNAKKLVMNRFSPSVHYKNLTQIYERATEHYSQKGPL